MDINELIQKVRKIEIRTKGLSKDLFSGDYHSAFKGRGMSFSEVREYSYGDDVRNIDWNVTARSGAPHIKVFEEERELTVILLIDVSASTYFGTRNVFKSDLITELTAVIAFSALQNNDKVGAILFTDHVEKYIPPKKGKQNILRIIRELLNFEPKGIGSDINHALIFLNNVQKKKAICFLMSDFLVPEFQKSLTVAAKRHDLIGMQIYDRREIELPNVGLIEVKDLETGQIKLLDTNSEQTRLSFKNRFEMASKNFNLQFKKAKSNTLSISTEDDYTKLLHQFFKKRAIK